MGWIFRLSLMNMKRRRERTLLTLLGVTIGVIAVVSLLALGIGVKNELMSEFGDTSSICNVKIINPSVSKNRTRLITDRNLKKFSEFDYVERVYPQYESGCYIKIGQYESYMGIIGLPMEELSRMKLIEGSALQNNGAKPSVILGNSYGMMLYNMNSGMSYNEAVGTPMSNLLGQNVSVLIPSDDNNFTGKLTVGGVCEGDAEDYSETSINAYCELDTLIRYIKKNGGNLLQNNENEYQEFVYTSAVLVVDDIEHVDFVVKKMKDLGYHVENDKEYLDTARRTVRTIRIMLAGIGMIALVVASIGISNTMTTSVYDRVKEIGILKVLGCDMDELMIMFMVEAGSFGLIGGLLGVGISYLIKNAINWFAVSAFELKAGTELIVIPFFLAASAVVMAVILALLSGFFPSRWAAKLKPIDAVQKE